MADLQIGAFGVRFFRHLRLASTPTRSGHPGPLFGLRWRPSWDSRNRRRFCGTERSTPTLFLPASFLRSGRLAQREIPLLLSPPAPPRCACSCRRQAFTFLRPGPFSREARLLISPFVLPVIPSAARNLSSLWSSLPPRVSCAYGVYPDPVGASRWLLPGRPECPTGRRDHGKTRALPV